MQNDTKAYGLYIDCHGSTTTLATNSQTILTTNQVKGNWHFVFLDACSTAANSNWPNAFKINSSYSKEHFLDGQLLFIQINHMIFVDIFGLRRQIEIIPIMCETLLFGLPIKYLTIQMVQHQHLLDFMEIGPIMAELIK